MAITLGYSHMVPHRFFRIACTALVAAALAALPAPGEDAHAAVIITVVKSPSGEEIVESTVGLGSDVRQAAATLVKLCGGEPQCGKLLVYCTGPGWYARVMDENDRVGIGGACGFPTRQQALARAIVECRKTQGTCDDCESAYDSGEDREVGPGTIAIMGDDDERGTCP